MADETKPMAKAEAAAMVPVRIDRGYWPAKPIEDFVLDAERPCIEPGQICRMNEDEASDAAEKGILTILTPKAYASAKDKAAK